MDSNPLRERIGSVRQGVQGLLDGLPAHARPDEERLTSALGALREAVEALQRAETNLRADDQPHSSHMSAHKPDGASAHNDNDWLVDAFEHAPVATVVVDHDLHVVHANRAAMAFTEHPSEQMRGQGAGAALKCLNALQDPRGCGFSSACSSCAVRTTVQATHSKGDRAHRTPARLPLRRNGKTEFADLWVSTAPLDTPDEQLVLVFIEDASQIEQAQSLLKTFLEALPESALVVKPDGTIIEANSTFAERLGVAPENVLRQNAYDLLPEDVRTTRRAQVEQVLESGRPARFTDHRSGRCIDSILVPVARPDGCVHQLAIIGVDVTEQKQHEGALSDSEARYRQLVELAQEGIWVLDASGCTTFANARMAQMLGCTAEEMEGRAFYEFMDEPHITTAQTYFRNRQYGKSEHHEFEFRRSDGSVLFANLAAAPLHDDEGRFTGAFAVISDISERKLAEQELKRTLEATTDGIWSWSFVTGELTFSPRYYTMLGYEPNEFPANFENWQDLIHPDDRAQALAAADTYLRTKPDTYENEFRLRAKDGTYRWILAKARVVERGPDNQPIRMIGNHEDITERKRAHEALNAANRRLKALWDIASLVDPDEKSVADHVLTALTQMTDSPYGFYGFMNEDESVMTIHSWSGEAMADCRLVNKPQRFPIREAGIWGEAVRNRETLLINEYDAPHAAKHGLPEGHVRLDSLLVVPQFVDQRITAVAAVANKLDGYTTDDETQIKSFLNGVQAFVEKAKTKRMLVESEARYRTVADFTYDWETWIGTDGQLIYCSPSVKRMTGYSPEELLSDPSLMERMVHPSDRPAMADHLRRESTENPGVCSLDYRIVTKSGDERWLSHYCTPVYDDEGRFAGRRGGTRDITDRKQLAEQLRQAQKLEAVGQLAGGVAHDFNNLLTAIIGNAERLEQTVAGDLRGAQALEAIREATRQATGVTRALLTFSSRIPTEKQRVDVFALVKKTTHLLERMTPASTSIVVDPDDETPVWIYADGTQLQQVVMNLVINARDAMPDGGRIHIGIQQASGPVTKLAASDSTTAGTEVDRFVKLIIADTGTGMPAQIKERIFEPFFTTKERGQGTGLGLAIVHGIVKDHNGHIDVDSAPGEGTTVTITLPVLEFNQASAAIDQGGGAGRAEGELVLLAEDNWNIRSLVATVLRDVGFEVCEVADGQSLIASFEDLVDRVSLFVLDVDLPHRSGLDCLRTMRTRAASTPAIIITGGGQLLDSHELDKHTILLRKPFGMAELRQKAIQLACAPVHKEAGV